MSAAYARSDYNDENLHRRDGSLLRRKREQWAKEKAEVDSWFPFGSPGGGAPNKKYEAVSPIQLEKPENRPSSCRSNGDSGRWSDSENVGPSKENSEQESRHSEVQYPYMAASTSSATSTVYLPAGAQISEGPTFQPLPHIANSRNGTYIAPPNASIPVQLVCPPISYGQAVPIPVELSQAQAAQFPMIYPLRLLPSTPASCSTSNALEERRADIPTTLNASYTEQWANQLPYWGTAGSYKEDPLSPKEITSVPFSSIPSAQPLAVVKPMVIPFVTPLPTEQPYSPANPSGSDDIAHGSMSESSTSLNSSCRRTVEPEYTGRASISEQAINEQIAEKHRAELRRAEEERRETLKREDERLRMEESQRNHEMEEERRKKKAEEQQKKREEAVLAAIEEAKRNAEKLRKAKLYKHVLEDTENTVDLEHSILGDDDANNVKILKEVESMERQKKYELKNFETKPKALIGKRKEDSLKSTEQRRISLDDERPIRPSSRMNHTYSGYSNNEEPLGRNRHGRQSLRLPASQKSMLKPRTSSLERQPPESSKGLLPGKSNVRKPTLSCAIPVRPQRRIPPPSARSRRTSNSNEGNAIEGSTQNEDFADVISIAENVQSSLNNSGVSRTGKKSHTNELCYEYLFPASSTSATPITTTSSSSNNTISATPIRSVQQRQSSRQLLSLLSDIPSAEEKTSTKRRTSHPNEDSFLQNPLFQPVATRCRRTRASMDNSESIRTSPSTSSDNSTPASNEENRPVDVVSVMVTAEVMEPDNSAEKKTAEKLPASNSTVNRLLNDNATNYSPFRKKLANTNVLNRHREEELLSPEIKRRGECPPSSSLRSSLANLSVDGSEDGRVSPVSPLIQRFNSKTSQYRSLNLKKTSERNQKILDRLAELRSRLPQHHAFEKTACTKIFSSAPRQVILNGNAQKPSKSVTAM